MSAHPVWEQDGRDWPNRGASRFVAAAGLRWHVQIMGSGPVILLAHGTGAATHSWRALAPLLGARFTVVAPDLPGHGFSEMPPPQRMSLPGMAQALGGLLRTLGLTPALVAGHSAGAAVLARMVLDGVIAPHALVGLNAALLPLGGAHADIFAPLARAVAGLSIVPRIFAWRAADPAVVLRLMQGTGSAIDAEGLRLYGRLARRPGHIAAAFAMMANWDLRGLARDLPRLKLPLVLVVGSNDRTIAPADAVRVRALVPGAGIVTLPGLGHLAHEERPDLVADLLIRHAATAELCPA